MEQTIQQGSAEQPIEQTNAQIEAIEPKTLICNNCQTEISEIHSLSTSTTEIRGIEAVFAGVCGNCDQTTWAIKGDHEAVAKLMALIEAEAGSQ